MVTISRSPGLGPTPAPASRRRSVRRTLAIEMVVAASLVVVGLVGSRLNGSDEERHLRPFLGTWTEVGADPARTLEVRPDHRARLGDEEVRREFDDVLVWRIPPPPRLVLARAGGAKVLVATEPEGLVTWDGGRSTHWKRPR